MESQIICFKLHNGKIGKRIAAFDYDSTLVVPKSEQPFPKDKDDWMWMTSNVPEVLADFKKRRFSLVIFTNQTKPFKLEMVKESLESLNIPMTVFISYKKKADKPAATMFQNNISEFNQKLSFYCGDAAGRKGDWSDMDKIFAANIGITFKVPEDVFKVAKPTPMSATSPVASSPNPSSIAYHKKEQEMIVLVGYPGSGKTTFAETHFVSHGYSRMDGDSLKTPKNIAAKAILEIQDGKSVVIDATNATKNLRDTYSDIAKGFNIPVRFFHIATGMREAMQQNRQRDKPVPDIVYYVYRKRFEAPNGENVITIVL